MHKRIYVLRFPKEVIDQPIICHLVKKFDVEFNILQATISLEHEGIMVIELMGHKNNVRKGLDYLEGLGVKVEKVATGIKRDDDKCYQCGLCTSVCTTGALAIRRPDMTVVFSREDCSGCGLCVPICPVRAMDVSIRRTVGALG